VVLITPVFVVDDAWKDRFGEGKYQIPNALREVPTAFIYVKVKYGKVPHWLLIDRVMEQCDCGSGTARRLIKTALKRGMICSTKVVDKRQLFYYLTENQMTKLHEIEEIKMKALELAKVQARDPNNREAGKTPENASWYRNVMDLVMRQDKTYHDVIEKLKRISHLCLALAIVAAIIIAVADPSFAAMTRSGGKL
jgi:hypothetical protein